MPDRFIEAPDEWMPDPEWRDSITRRLSDLADTLHRLESRVGRLEVSVHGLPPADDDEGTAL